MRPAWAFLVIWMALPALAQEEVSVKQLMLDLIHPASNDILLFVNRGAPKTEAEWSAVRRSAITLEEAGGLLMTRSRARDQGGWAQDAKALSDVGALAYKAARGKDLTALAALTESLDASCTGCHKQYRPNVFPREGGSK